MPLSGAEPAGDGAPASTSDLASVAALGGASPAFRQLFENAPGGAAIVRADHVVVEVNRALADWLGYAPAELCGRQLRELIHTGDLLPDPRHIAAGDATTGHFAVERRFRRRGGGIAWGDVRISALRHGQGEPDYFICQVHDITDRKVLAAEPLPMHQNVWEVLDRITDGFIAVDREWRITYLSDAAAQMARIPPDLRDDIVGQNLWGVAPMAVDTPVYDAAQQALATGEPTDYVFWYEWARAWIAGRVYPSPGGLSFYFRDVTQQRQAELANLDLIAELQRANQELERRNAIKNEFVSVISHEFRTPLTSIQGFSELLAEESLSEDESHEFAERINANACRLARLIDDMLSLDRMESHHDDMRRLPVDLADVITGVAQSFAPLHPRHPILLESSGEAPVVMGDRNLLIQLFTNLVGNAIKYSPAGGVVSIAMAPVGAAVEVSVADQGMGVPADQREAIFTRYLRLRRPEQQGIEGTGLGLAIARQIVDLHGGRIWVEDNEPQGTVFRIELPMAESLPPDAAQFDNG